MAAGCSSGGSSATATPDPASDGSFEVADGVRCIETPPGAGKLATKGEIVDITTTTWVENPGVRVDLKSPRDPREAMLRPGSFRGVVGEGHEAGYRLDQILSGGPQPMKAAGTRRCSLPPERAGLFRAGIPGWPTGATLVVEVRVNKIGL
jgi:hypothetical protein